MRRAAAVVTVLGLLGLLAGGLLSTTDEAFTLGVTPLVVAADITPGQRICQVGVQAPPGAPATTAVRLRGRATGARPTRFSLTIGTSRGTATLPAVDGADATVRLSAPVRLREPGSVCIRNEGPARLQLFGNGGVAAPTSELQLDGQSFDTDLAIVFERQGRPRLALAADLVRRASLWRAGWVGPWTYVVLGLLLVVAGPLLLLRALREPQGGP